MYSGIEVLEGTEPKVEYEVTPCHFTQKHRAKDWEERHIESFASQISVTHKDKGMYGCTPKCDRSISASACTDSHHLLQRGACLFP